MHLPRDAVLLRIYVGETAKVDGHPVYESLVMAARRAGLAGATVLRGPMGFGHSSRLHTAKILQLSEDLPVVVEMVDAADKVDAFLPTVETLMAGRGLVTLEKVQVLSYGPVKTR